MAAPSKALIRDLRRVVGTSHVLHRPDELLAYEYDAAVDRALPEVVVSSRVNGRGGTSGGHSP